MADVDPRIFGGLLEARRRRAARASLRVSARGPGYRTRRFGEVPFVDASAIAAADALHVFAVNRSTDRTAPLSVSFGGATLAGVGEAEVLTGPSARARNSSDAPEVVTARPFTGATVTGQSAELLLPPLSLVAATFPIATS